MLNNLYNCNDDNIIKGLLNYKNIYGKKIKHEKNVLIKLHYLI
jgi:hypothetical protein